MWNEILIGTGGIITFNVLMYNVGRYWVRKEAQYSLKQLQETKEMLEVSKEEHNKQIEEIKDLMDGIELHFKELDLNT